MDNSDFKLRDMLATLGLSADNSVVIGSGILNALGIRKSADVDVVVGEVDFERLDASGQFSSKESYGRPVLVDDIFEIGTSWDVLGKDYRLNDFITQTTVIDGVRYISIDFLLRVKQSWVKGGTSRPKDIDDIGLIESYLKRID